MQTEAQCPASARYLAADALYTDAALQTMQADCVQRYQSWGKDAAYYSFVQWTRQANEVVVFTWNAYADLALPKQFDCLFHLDNPQEHLLLSYQLTQSVINLGGWATHRPRRAWAQAHLRTPVRAGGARRFSAPAQI